MDSGRAHGGETPCDLQAAATADALCSKIASVAEPAMAMGGSSSSGAVWRRGWLRGSSSKAAAAAQARATGFKQLRQHAQSATQWPQRLLPSGCCSVPRVHGSDDNGGPKALLRDAGTARLTGLLQKRRQRSSSSGGSLASNDDACVRVTISDASAAAGAAAAAVAALSRREDSGVQQQQQQQTVDAAAADAHHPPRPPSAAASDVWFDADSCFEGGEDSELQQLLLDADADAEAYASVNARAGSEAAQASPRLACQVSAAPCVPNPPLRFAEKDYTFVPVPSKVCAGDAVPPAVQQHGCIHGRSRAALADAPRRRPAVRRRRCLLACSTFTAPLSKPLRADRLPRLLAQRL